MAPDDTEYLNKYENNSDEPNHIVVIGVGGGGNNAVNYMYRQDIQSVSFVVANTDRQALESSPVPNKLLLGPTVTRGRGAGAKPERARAAAEESATDIDKVFDDDVDMVFVTAGMGGGTGTGAAPVVARIARERGLLTIGIVTIPFLFEGLRKINKALAGAEEMSKYVDALLVINNERLTDIYPDEIFEEAFAKADDTLATAARSISEIITNEGYINLDFNDVDTTLRDGGTAIISIGYGEGENRVTKAIEDALNSPLLNNTDVFTSKHLLFNLCYSREAEDKFKAREAREFNEFVSKIDPQVEVIWGIKYDETLGNKVKLTVLASGFDITIRENSQGTPDIVLTGEQTGSKAAEPDTIDTKKLTDWYGDDKIGETIRTQDRQRYIILDDDSLDNDEVIERFEKNPAYNRDRRVAQNIKGRTPAPAAEQRTAPAADPNSINFMDEE
ncbi:MAG: cell division protein FtsZ [Muribaculaceae bacterium]|nr:cell division protein FtsZ [Muribaculaceae bacterium]